MRHLHIPARRTSVAALAAGALVVGGQVMLFAAPAAAATTLTVSTTADVATATGACGNTGITSAPSPLSLREATCLANNIGGAVSINVPAGTYNVVNGELQLGARAGESASIAGAGAGSTIIDAKGNSRVLDLDFNLTGGVTNSVSGVTITGGSDETFGGAGIIGGSNNNTTGDSLTLNNAVVTDNHANSVHTNVTNKPGGGLQFLGGQLTITNSTFSNNSSGSSYGSGVAYGANGYVSPEGLSISGTTFSGNSAIGTSGDGGSRNGGALELFGTASSTFAVAKSQFVNNSVAVSSGSGNAVGAGIWEQSGNLTVTGTNFTGNSATGGSPAPAPAPAGGAIFDTAGTATLHYNRFIGNTAASGSGVSTDASGTVAAADNWWGCNAGPGAAGCDTVAGAVTTAPRLVLSAGANPSTVTGPNATSTLTASLAKDSAGTAIGGANLTGFDALPVTFSDPAGDATVTTNAGAHTAAFSSGQAAIDFHSNTTTGTTASTATFDNASVNAAVLVVQSPAITSANTAKFTPGNAGSFTVTTTGYPTAAITESGALPAGMTFTDNGNGTATLAGTPTGGGGTFPLNLTANNGVSPNATQTLTVSVGQAPTFTSTNSTAFTVGAASSFTVTTSGSPVSTITESGALPAGLTFTDKGDGTATLAGTPTGPGGSFSLNLTATNGVTPNATQSLTVTVNQSPAITTDVSSQIVPAGFTASFTAVASGYPTPTVQWQMSTDGTTFTNIAGATSTTYTRTAAAGDNGSLYRAVFTNVAGTITSSVATLTVQYAPVFNNPNNVTFTVGQPASFTTDISANPRNGGVGHSVAPAGLAYTAASSAKALNVTLSGTPTTAGVYVQSLNTSNSIGSGSQDITVTINGAPTVTTNPTDQTTPPSRTITFSAAATGYPVPTVQWQRSTDGGNSFNNIAGATSTSYAHSAASTENGYLYRAVFTNTLGNATTTAATLHVGSAPAFTSSSTAEFAVGVPATFTVSTSGMPAAQLTTSGTALPSWLTFTDNGDGTGILGANAPAGSGGTYSFTLNAANGFAPNATQAFTLQVDQSPTITSPDHASFAALSTGSFAVATTAGFPTATALSETGGLPSGVTFVDDHDGTATLAGKPVVGSGGSYPITISADASGGLAAPATQSFTLTVLEPASISSADAVSFAVGSSGSFAVVTSGGYPTPAVLTETGALPGGVTFVDKGNGTATLAGIPAGKSGGSYPLTITADNGVAPTTTQHFTLTVADTPMITSANSVTFDQSDSQHFDVSTTPGYPAGTTLSEKGALPAGATFTDKGDGTATLSYTPTSGDGGTYPVTLTASNTAGHTDQSFTITVREAPHVTSANTATFDAGSHGSFTVQTEAGYPAGATLSEAGDLPGGVTFVDNGDGTATLAGTPAATSGGSYPVTITVGNGAASSTQDFTLVVDQDATITSANSATLTIGTNGSVTVTTTGYPKPAISEDGALPEDVTFVDNGNGTATLTGTPAPGSAGGYPLTIHAGAASQAFTLTVSTVAQTITAAPDEPASGTVGGSYTPAATSTSGLSVAISIDTAATNSACSYDGTAVSFDHAGTCVVDYDQAGNSAYAPAPQVQRSFPVGAISTTTTVLTSAGPSVYGQSVHATATTPTGVAGSVQFSVDGAKLGATVTVVGGSAGSGPLVDAAGHPLTVASHAVGVTFTPADTTKYAASSNSVTQVVNQAITTTKLTVAAASLSAAIAPVAPGAGSPGGSVTFSVAGAPVGTAPVTNGAATLSYSVPAGKAQQVAAAYSGDTDFAGSSDSTARTDPTITATQASAHAKTRYGWYRSPVTVTFRCTTHGAALVGSCPSSVTLSHNGGGQSVRRTVSASDGGMATVVVRNINIDRSAPSVRVSGVRNGAVYSGSVPRARCIGTDAVSGLASCTLIRHTRNGVTSYRATASDRAGNTRTVSGTYRTLHYTLLGATYSRGAFAVRVGHTYTLVVYAGSRPVYYDAAVFNHKPTRRDHALHHSGHDRWSLGVTMTRSLRSHTYWNLGIKVGHAMHRIKIRVHR